MIFALIVTLLVAILIGIPIGFSIILSVVVSILVSDSSNFFIVVERLVNGGAGFTLLALPLFILAGKLMIYGSTSRLMNLANMLLGRVPGGMGSMTVIGSTFFGSVSGSGIATTAAIGSVVGPEMTKQGFNKGFTASLLAGSGSLGVMIPPSIAAVIYATTADVSVGKQLFAGVGPGLMTMLALIGISIVIAIRNKIGTQRHVFTKKERIRIFLQGIPPLIMPIIILGGIMGGIATPTESAGVAVIYAMILSIFIYREVDFKRLIKVFSESTVTSAVILIIMAAAAPFSWILTIENVPKLLAETLGNISNSSFVIMGIVIFIIFLLGIFMEGASIIILMTPLLLPVVTSLGYDPIHFGVILLSTANIGVVTPPLAVGLFVACDVMDIKIEEVFPHIFNVLIAMIVAVIIITLWPALALWLPELLM